MKNWVAEGIASDVNDFIQQAAYRIALKGLYWQAHLHLNNDPVCGATIIDEETVLTTTSCVFKPFSNPLELEDKTKLEIEAGVVSHGDAAAQIKGISEIIVHPCNKNAEVTIDKYVPYN